jgi:hypothetical protein
MGWGFLSKEAAATNLFRFQLFFFFLRFFFRLE